MNPLIIALLAAPSAEEQRVRKFAEWMGVRTKSILIDDRADPLRQLLDVNAAGCCLAMSAETLACLYVSSKQPAHLRAFFEKECAALLVFHCGDRPQHDAPLSWLTRGAIRRMAEGVDQKAVFQMPRAGQMFSRQLAGLTFSIGRRTSYPAFEPDACASGVEPIMLANHRVAFLCQTIGSCRLFLLAGSETPAIEEPLSRGKGIEQYYDQIIPFLIFLRSCFGDACWHAPKATARFIIDDPLLMDRYGLLDYKALLSSMSRIGYGTSIAFIPWNYRRTSRQWAASLLEKKANLSVCVHGCDHTNKEFDDFDRVILEDKARLALARMEKHEERTGLPFERVMVFPQGRFSTSAISALRANDYLAAVNTSCFPTDYVPDGLKMGDFLRPAVTRFSGFPIFQRHYPQNPIDFAFDMFLGKPALLVEHHQYLGDGCEKLEEFVEGLHRIEPELSWPSLTTQLADSCMMKASSADSFEVKFFTRRFRLKNTQTNKCNYLLEKDEPDASVIRTIQIDGQSVPFRSTEDIIQLELELESGQTRQIEIVDHPRPDTPAKRLGVTYSFGVLFRRELSEFRDNTLSRHPTMLKATREVAKRMKMTGDRKKEVES
jgi:hypothetical protein